MKRFFVARTAGIAALFAIASPSSHAGQPAPGQGWDSEISCCFSYDDFRPGSKYYASFVITLGGEEAVAELKLTTPDGASVGFDDKTRLYKTIAPGEAAYARLVTNSINPQMDVQEDSDWDNESERFLLINPRKGEYTLEVIGVHDGRYAMSIYPLGYGRLQSGPGQALVHIKPGEIHTYLFPGDFDQDNPHFGAKPFYLKRVVK